jgi:photosystem II stability/assembly factor-like uncharacterized protein
MKPRSLPALCLLAGAPLAAAQTVWIRQSPYPADVDVHAVWFSSPDVGWIAGADDLLMGTSDGGATWAQTPSLPRDPQFAEDPIWHVQFTDPLHGFAMGNLGYRTVDGGASWQGLGPTPPGSVYDFEFLDPLEGYCWDRRSIFRTLNGAASWAQALPFSLDHFVLDVDFLDANLALAVGEISNVTGVFRSTSAGSGWQLVSSQPLERVLYLNASEVVGSDGARFYRSVDGGASWTLTHDGADPLSQADVQALCRIDDDSAAAIGFDARIWITHDRGQTWTLTKEPTGTFGHEWDVQFPSPDVGYAAGRLGLVYKSVDGGASWTQLSHGAAKPMHDVVMRPSGRGMAVGDYGAWMRTDDHGQHWTAAQMRAVGRSFHVGELDCVEALDEDTWIVGGDFGRVFRTDDGGDSWVQLLELGLDAEVFDTSFVDDQHGWVFARTNAPQGAILRTSDGGQSWQTLYQSNPYPTVGQMLDLATGHALLPQTTERRTTDGFVTSSTHTLPNSDAWSSMEYHDVLHGWYGGFYGGVLSTTDGGATMQSHPLPGFHQGGSGTDDRLTDLRATATDEVYIATTRPGAIVQGRIYHSSDGGASWQVLTAIHSPTNQFAGALSALDVLPDGSVWATGGNGFVFASNVPEEPITRYCGCDTAPCGNDDPSAGCANSSGVGATLSASGTTDVSFDDLVLTAQQLLPGQPALLFAGEQQVNGGAGLPFGDGLRCAGTGVVRLGTRVPDAQGAASWGPGLAASAGWTGGDVRHVQAWYRDPSGSPCGGLFNLTDALTVTFRP